MSIHAFTFDDPVDAHDSMCETLVYGDRYGQDWDWTHGTEVGLHNVAIYCKSIDFDYNLKNLWVPPSRWAMMVRQYLDPSWLDDALDKIEERMSGPRYGGNKGRGISVVRMGEHDVSDEELFGDLDDIEGLTPDELGVILKTRMVQGKGTGRGVRRRWGSCMLNLSYRTNPEPTVSLHSRTTYFGYLALVDMAVARTFAAECAHITGIPLEQHRFVWTLDLAQFHGFRSLAWMLTDPEIRDEMNQSVDNRTDWSAARKNGNQPGWRKALDGYARILKSDRAGVKYGDESFSSFARVRRRFHTEVYGVEYSQQFAGGTRNRGGKAPFPPLPDLWVRNLDFTALGKSGPVGDGYDDEED